MALDTSVIESTVYIVYNNFRFISERKVFLKATLKYLLITINTYFCVLTCHRLQVQQYYSEKSLFEGCIEISNDNCNYACNTF